MEDESARRAALWTLVGVILGFKIWAIILIMAFSPTGEALAFMVAMNWPFALGGLILVAGPALFWYRLLRARARRRRLQWQEWHLEEGRAAERSKRPQR